MDCKVCKHEMMVLDKADLNKPLRCSDACPENRKSLAQRNPVDVVNIKKEASKPLTNAQLGLKTAKRKKK